MQKCIEIDRIFLSFKLDIPCQILFLRLVFVIHKVSKYPDTVFHNLTVCSIRQDSGFKRMNQLCITLFCLLQLPVIHDLPGNVLFSGCTGPAVPFRGFPFLIPAGPAPVCDAVFRTMLVGTGHEQHPDICPDAPAKN